MQASLALAARFGTCVAGTFPLRRACRHAGALTPGRRPATRRAAFASTADGAVGGGGSASATKASPGDAKGVSRRKGGKRDLDEAYGDIRAILTDPTRLVRAVASGKAKGATPQWRRLEMRPVLLKKGGVKLQVVKYDERQAFTSNHAYADARDGADDRTRSQRDRRSRRGDAAGGIQKKSAPDASAAADEALALGFGSWRVEAVDTITQVKVTKSGEAQWHQTGQLLANARGGPDTGTGAIGGMRVAVPDAGAVGAHVASHDRVKPRLLSPSDPFLRAVGVSTADGKSIKASRRDKYKQVEEFVKLVKLAVEDARTGGHLKTPSLESPARLVDLGCGNAYLTFGAYAHLSSKSSSFDTTFHMEVVGVDIKKQSRETNTRVAAELGWDEACVFVEGAIADADVSSSFATRRGEQEEQVDIVLALHACDTATDEAIARAVRWRAPLTLVAPCCHHDLQVRMKRAAKNSSAPPHKPLARHGILRERLGDVLTDAFRAHVLRLLGHRVDVTEWIGGEHTPRNTMIRAVRTNQRANRDLWAEYDALCEDWEVTPRLAEMLAPELEEARAEAMAYEGGEDA